MQATFNPFIVSTNVQKTDAKTRKLIRSHVMLGKNRGKRRVNKPKTDGVNNDRDAANGIATYSSSSSDDELQSVIPVKVGTDYSLLKLAAAVDPILIRHFLQCQSITQRTSIQ